MQTINISLSPAQFPQNETLLASNGSFQAIGFRFPGGVPAIRLENKVGYIVVLPWQGQQIWSANFHGRELTMKSMFDEPRANASYLETYGAFLLHCGATAMGVPGPEDNHPLHGELPNAPYQSAYLEFGEDEEGEYIAIGGNYRHTVAFTCNYTAAPRAKLHAGSGVIDISIDITNHKITPMEWMYLAHINFRPVEGAQLVYSAPCDKDHVRVRKSVPSHITTPPGYREFLDELEATPEKHNTFRNDLPFNPEVCFYLDYNADSEGWAHSLQVLPDGNADYVAHKPGQLNKAIRWIANTGDQAAMGLVLPATAEPEGYHAEKEKGNIRILEGGQTTTINLKAGALSTRHTTNAKEKISNLGTNLLREN